MSGERFSENFFLIFQQIVKKNQKAIFLNVLEKRRNENIFSTVIILNSNMHNKSIVWKNFQKIFIRCFEDFLKSFELYTNFASLKN